MTTTFKVVNDLDFRFCSAIYVTYYPGLNELNNMPCFKDSLLLKIKGNFSVGVWKIKNKKLC